MMYSGGYVCTVYVSSGVYAYKCNVKIKVYSTVQCTVYIKYTMNCVRQCIYCACLNPTHILGKIKGLNMQIKGGYSKYFTPVQKYLFNISYSCPPSPPAGGVADGGGGAVG